MQTKSDAELLQDYVTDRSEAAFDEIVRRYAGFVYSAALRQVGNPEAARDVAQTVFSDLARKAGSLHPNTLLIGWLSHGARLASLEQLRRDSRRLQREKQAMDWHQSSPEVAPNWEELRPALDEGMASLGDMDRDALLLRFFKDESLASVGVALGVSEDAAQKRVSRALEKLREFLAARGIMITVTALSGAIAAHGVECVPAGLAASLSSAAVASAIAGNAAAPFSKLLTISNMKYAILTLVLLAAIAGLEYKRLNAQRQIRAARAAANQQAQEIQTLRAVNDRNAGQTNELEKLRSEAQDVARLRAEADRLRKEQAALKLKAQITLAETNTTPEAPHILVTARFISAPTDNLGGPAWPKPTDGGTALMDGQQFKAMLHDFEIIEGAELLSQSRISTANDTQASLSSTRNVPLGGTNVSVGETLMVNPHYSKDSPNITLDLAAKSSRLVDLSREQDESLADLRTTTITNSITVLDGQSVILRKDLRDEGRVVGSTNTVSRPKSLLVVLTPQLVRADGTLQRLQRIVKRDNNGQ